MWREDGIEETHLRTWWEVRIRETHSLKLSFCGVLCVLWYIGVYFSEQTKLINGMSQQQGYEQQAFGGQQASTSTGGTQIVRVSEMRTKYELIK